MNYRNENQAQSLGHHPTFTWRQLQAAVLAEREACAKLCDEMGAIEALDGEEGSAAMVRVADKQAALCAAAIRARGEK